MWRRRVVSGKADRAAAHESSQHRQQNGGENLISQCRFAADDSRHGESSQEGLEGRQHLTNILAESRTTRSISVRIHTEFKMKTTHVSAL